MSRSPTILWTTDRELVFTSSCGGGLARLGLGTNQVVGLSLYEFFGENEVAEAIDKHRETLAGAGGSFEQEFVGYAYSVRVEPLRDDDGTIIGTVGLAVDITERRRAQRIGALLFRLSEEAFAAEDLDAFFAALHQIVGELLFADNFYVALRDEDSKVVTFPYFADEVDTQPGPQPFGKSPTDLVLDSGRPLLLTRSEFRELAETGDVEIRGSLPVAWLGVPLHENDKVIGVLAVQSYDQHVRYGDDEQEILVYISRHISTALARRTSELALRESEERYRRLFEEDLTGVLISDADGTILQCNPAFAQIFDFDSVDQAEGSNLGDLYRSRDRRREIIARLRKDRRLDFDEVEARSIRGRRLFVSTTLLGGFDENDELDRIRGYVYDITKRKTLEAQLRQGQRLESLGRLAGGVAHDFNNQLTAILGYCELMLRKLDDDSSLRSSAIEIRRAGQRAAELTHQLMAFSKRQALDPRPTDLNAVVKDMKNMLRILIGEDYSLETDLASDLGLVLADPGQIEQVILNLVVNARDASPGGGSIRIETCNSTIGTDRAPQLAPGHYVCLRTVDKGVGIDGENLERLFEPFFTTKTQGTGLGLSTVHGIVEQSGGTILVDSDLERGSTFEIYLPRTSVSATSEVSPGVTASVGGSETILLVEDEPAVRRLAVSILTQLGYRVLAAESPSAALEICEGKFLDLLITDVVLPEISGRDLAARLIGSQPTIAVLFVSGYTDSAIIDRGIRREETAFLAKPFQPDELAQKVRELLDARKESLATKHS